MTSRFKIWNNVHRAMTPLAHWYTILDHDVILDIQNRVIHEILHDRTCLIKWAPMHKQVTMLQKLLSHIFEQYADVKDDGYISDEDIEEHPETFMPKTTHNACVRTRTNETAAARSCASPTSSQHRAET